MSAKPFRVIGRIPKKLVEAFGASSIQAKITAVIVPAKP